MRKVGIKVVGIALGLTMCFGRGVVNFLDSKGIVPASAIGNYSTDASTYYNDITATSGTQLAAQLHDLITSTHRYYTSYDDNGKNKYQQQTDQYYENGSKVSGYIYEFYSGVKWPNAWDPNSGSTTGGYNREHCWCQSNSVNTAGTQMWGETGGGADMHHLRPSEVRLNSTRGNNKYGEISSRDSSKVYAKFGTNETYAHGGYLKNSTFEPLDSKKGDVSRIILYTYLHYNSYTISTLFGSYGTTNGNGSSSYFSTSLLSLTKITNQTTEDSAIEMLLEWNESDPVDEIEQRRNEQVAIYQGNRNPFIDNSNYANMIWGSATPSPTVNSVSVSPTTLNLDLNGTTTGNLTATVNVSYGAAQTVTWTSSNSNVATVSSSGVVTAVAKGTCSVTATSTVNSNKSASCTVKVTDSSGGGGSQVETGDFTWNLATNSYDANPTTDLVTWSHEYANMTLAKGNGNTAANNYLGGDSNNRTSSRFYSGHTLTITPSSNYTITSIEFTATSTNYASTLQSSTWSNASASVSSTLVTITPVDGSSAISATIGGTCGFTATKVYYSYETSASASSLSSISLNTSNVQIEFSVGDTFEYSGLVVTAHYEDGTEDIVNPTSVSTPDMSTSGNKTVTVSYTENAVTRSETYTISVLEAEATEIYASVDKTYHPGETILASDISVEDDLGNEISNFTFANAGYQFTYSDAASGGTLTNKTFVDAITGAGKTCSLTVQVQRKAREEAGSVTDTITATGLGVTGNSYASYTNKTFTSDAVYCAYCMKDSNNNIQMRTTNSNSGVVSTTSGGQIKSVIINVGSGTKTVQVYAKNTAYSSPSDLFSDSTNGTLIDSTSTTKTITFTDSYTYFGVKSSSGAIYLSSIVVTYGSEDSAVNLANYIMYEDTSNQCISRFPTAKGYFEGLSASERSSFMTSNDYVILEARTRFNDWAKHLGKSIVYQNGDYVVNDSKSVISLLSPISNNNEMITIIVVSLVGVTSIGGYFFIHRRKESN